jgi:hypothetical protein
MDALLGVRCHTDQTLQRQSLLRIMGIDARRADAGGAGLGAKPARMVSGADELASAVRDAAPAPKTRPARGSALLMFLVVGLLAGSALISLTLLWAAIRAMRWLFGE